MESYTNKKGFFINKYDETLSLTDCITKRGYYRFLLYDTTRGMNIGRSDESEIVAMFEALKYYQKRLLEVENNYKNLQNKVDNFLMSFNTEEELINE